MFKRIHQTALLGMAIVLSGCAAGYKPEPVDTSVKATVERWSAQSGRTLEWQIDDFEFTNAAAFSEVFGERLDFGEALLELLNRAQAATRGTARTDGDLPPQHVHACVFRNKVVVQYTKGAGLPCSAGH